MRKRDGPESGLAPGRQVQANLRARGDRPLPRRRDLDKQVMRVLTVDQQDVVKRLASLKELGAPYEH